MSKGRGPQNMGYTIKRLMKYLGKYKLKLAIVVVLIAVNAFSSIAGVYFLAPIVNDYILPGDFIGLKKVLIVLACIFIAGALSAWGYARIMVGIAQKCIRQIRADLFHKMQTLPIQYFDTHTNGDLMSLYTNDIESVNEALNNSIGTVFAATLSFIGTLTMMILMSPALTLLTAIMLLIVVFLVKSITKKSGRYFAMTQMRIGALNGYVEEMIEGQKVVKVFCHEEKAIEDFKVRNNALKDASTLAQTHAGSMMPIMGNLSHISYAINCCVGALFAIAGFMSIGNLLAFLQYVKQVSQPITQISQQSNVIIAAAAGAERIFRVIDTPSEVDEGHITLTPVIIAEDGRLKETKDRTGHWAWKNGDVLTLLQGDVDFHNVLFGYVPEKLILKGISLEAKPGQKVAFVGTTGAGKTTITNLINRFYELNSGYITYDGIDMTKIKKDDLRRSIGIVLQDTHLFTGTIADNIRYGKLDATDEEVVHAAQLANADTFIKHLPHGYDTVLTGDGEGLSQGQRQLLAIARAAIADPPVLIMDEATSSIDTRTEKLIVAGMDKLMAGRTTFVIAHRLSTIRNSDMIIVLEQGQIIERGTHEALLEQKGRYYQLYTGKKQ